MPETIGQLHSEERGFTLIELLVVILIVGILAAIALPAFLSQQKKGQDAEAQSNARNLYSQVESCFTQTQDFGQCRTAAQLGTTGLDWGTGPSQVSVFTDWGANDIGIRAVSKSGNDFYLIKYANGQVRRSCNTSGTGGCKAGGGDWGAGHW